MRIVNWRGEETKEKKSKQKLWQVDANVAWNYGDDNLGFGV
jgi:hypothetical protein